MDNNTIHPHKTQLMEDELYIKLSRDKSVHIVLKSFNKTNEHKYLTDTPHILAIDKDLKCGKFYLCFKHITDKIDFITRWKHQNLYEIITNVIVKPYFDIDYKVGKYKTDEQDKKILTELITEFNKYYLHPATIENAYCYGKRDKTTQLWKSIHIVIDGFMTTKNSLKDFCEDINTSRSGFKLIVGKLDSKVYTHNRCFSFIHQRKMGGEEFFEWIYCWDGDGVKYTQHDITYKYLINDVSAKKCKLNHHHDTSPIYFDETKNKIIKKEAKSLKRKTAIETKELVIITERNIVDELLKHLPTDFFDSSLWFKISIQIFLHQYSGADKWKSESATKSQHDYTHAQNKKFAENISDKYFTNNIQKIFDELNDAYGLCLIWDLLDTFTEQLKIWICEKTNTDMIDLKKAIMTYKDITQSKKHSSDERLIVGNNFVFDMRKQTLKNDVDKRIFHYGMDSGYGGQYGVDTTKFKTITQDEIKDTMEWFLKSPHRLCGFKMLWGSGKTHFGVDTIVKFAILLNIRILFLTENNNLNAEMSSKFNALSHLNKDELVNIDDATMVVCSLESLNTILNKNSKNFEIILFDEYESIIQHLLSTDTFKSTNTTPFEVSCLIKNVINDANKIVCLDCDLSEERMDLITNIFKENNDDEPPQLFNCSHNSWADYEYELYESVLNMRYDMKDDIFNKNKRIIYATCAKADAKNMYQDWRIEMEDKKIKKNMLVIHADNIEYYINGEKTSKEIVIEAKKRLANAEKSSNKDLTLIKTLKEEIVFGRYTSKDKLFKNLESVLIELDIDVFIYSPSIKCGISFGNDKNNLLFDRCYGYATNGSVVAREFLQMLHRCRHLRDKKISFNIKSGLTATSQLFKHSQIDNLIDKNQQLKFNTNWCDKNYDGVKYSIEDFYKSITNTNFKEMLDSQRNLTQEIMGKLKFTHKMKVSLKCFHEKDEKTTKSQYDDLNEYLKNENRLFYRHEKKLSQPEYDKAVADKTTNNSYEARRKYNTLRSLKLNQSNSKYLRRERLFEKKKRAKYHTPQSSGIFQNYITNKNGQDFYCFGSSQKDDVEYNERGEYLSFAVGGDAPSKWNEKSREEKNKYYYGDCDEASENIPIEDYDLDKLAQHTKQVGNLTFNTNDVKKDFLSHLNKANAEQISGYEYKKKKENEGLESDFTLDDTASNRLKIINKAMEIWGIDRKKLIKRRRIMTNKQLKDILDKNANWINNDLYTYINDANLKTIGLKSNMKITNYTSSNNTYFRYVKHFVITQLATIGIQTLNRNKSGGVEKNNYDNDVGLLVIQYEMNGANTYNTFINTYYDRLCDDVYRFHNGDYKKRDLRETITEKEFSENKTIKQRHNQVDKKYHITRNNFYKRNRYAICKTGDVERSVKIPFNIFSCDFCYDKSNNVIDMIGKTDDERVAIFIKNELSNQSLEPSYDMTDIRSRKNDIQLYKFLAVGWNNTQNKEEIYVREQIVKYSTISKPDNIIKDTSKMTEEEKINYFRKKSVKNIMVDVLRKLARSVAFKKIFNRVEMNAEYNRKIIMKTLEECRVASEVVNNETDKELHINIHKPNIYVKEEDKIYDSDENDEW